MAKSKYGWRSLVYAAYRNTAARKRRRTRMSGRTLGLARVKEGQERDQGVARGRGRPPHFGRREHLVLGQKLIDEAADQIVARRAGDAILLQPVGQDDRGRGVHLVALSSLQVLLHFGEDGRIFRKRAHLLRVGGRENAADGFIHLAVGGPHVLLAE